MNTKTLLDYTDGELTSAELHIRALGATPPKFGIIVRQADWVELHNQRSAIRKASQAVLKNIKDGTDEAECRKAEGVHDLLMVALDAIQDEMDLRDAHDTKEPVGNPNAPCQAGVGYGQDLGSASEFYILNRSGWADERGREIPVLSPDQPLTTERARGPGFGDMARAMIFGPRNDIERRALAEGSDGAGGYTVPTNLATTFIDKLRAQTVCFKAGAKLVAMTSDNLTIARLASDPTASWTAENAEITASDPTFEAVTLAPKKLAALVKVSRELLEDSVNISQILETAFMGALSTEMDRALLFGSGSSNQPTGLFNVSGINSVSMGTDGDQFDWDKVSDTKYEIKLDNAAEPGAMIYHPRTGLAIAKMKDGNGQWLTPPPYLANVRQFDTTAVPINQTQGGASNASCILMGDFSNMLVGMRTGIELYRLDQRYAEFDQIGFLARLRVDVAVSNPVHFAKLIGIIP